MYVSCLYLQPRLVGVGEVRGRVDDRLLEEAARAALDAVARRRVVDAADDDGHGVVVLAVVDERLDVDDAARRLPLAGDAARRGSRGVARAEGAGAIDGVEDVRVREEREQVVEEQLHLDDERDLGVPRRELQHGEQVEGLLLARQVVLEPQELERLPVWKSNLQPDFNVRICDRFDARFSAVLRELDESYRSVQKSAESTSI